jgi:nucleoid-associated protein YgaU
MAGTTQTFTKAEIRFVDPASNNDSKEVLPKIEFEFNPKDFSITRQADWGVPQGKGGNGKAQYNGPKPSQVQVEIFLDGTKETGDKADISKKVATLLSACNPTSDTKSKNKPSAPFAIFQWGKSITFKGYVEQVAVKYTLFRYDGTPVRGTATVTIKELAEPARGQNPTSGGIPGTTRHRVVAGDTLPSIAYREFGRASAWRLIAEANPTIDDPMRLRPGSVLLVPPA